MKIILKMVLFPIRFTLSIFTGAMNFILGSVIINRIFFTVSGVLFLGFLVTTWSAIFINQNMSLTARIVIPCVAFIASYITSPFTGAPKYLRLLIKRIENLNDCLRI